MYSIGSSIVMMWHALVMLICWMMAASVVDLPEPVGPVTRNSPLSLLATSSMADESISCFIVRMFDVMTRKAVQILPRSNEQLPRNREPSSSFARNVKLKSSSLSLFKVSIWLGERMADSISTCSEAVMASPIKRNWPSMRMAAGSPALR